MSRTTRFLSFLALAALAAVAASPVLAETPAAETAIGSDNCCFTNPRFTGTCTVTTGPDETCSDVLAYLNNQASVGKTYCGNTKVRGGWAQVECEGQASMCTGTSTTEAAAVN